MTQDYIVVRGGREHNLKNITVSIPKNELVVFTGMSGSGKSSLAFDTIYAEGQRRYLESLSAYARQFLGGLQKPDVDSIDGLSPAIAIDQKATSHNPRSTVGTVTEIYDYLRLLFARVGHPHCPNCGREIFPQSAPTITNRIFDLMLRANSASWRTQARFMLLSPVVKDRKGEFTSLFANLRQKGWQRVRIDRQVYNLDANILLLKNNRHTIEVVVDRFSVTKKKLPDRSRLTQSVETGLSLGGGNLILTQVTDPEFQFPAQPKSMTDTLFSEHLACPDCNLSLPPLEPRNFSFNSPHGACPTCHGLGSLLKVNPEAVTRLGLNAGMIQSLEYRYHTTTSDWMRRELERLMRKITCPTCQGQRLQPSSLAVTVHDRNIAQVTQFAIATSLDWVTEVSSRLNARELTIANLIIKELTTRLNFLNDVGLDYLTLAREAASLSGGEAQRIRLASQIGTGLTGVLYVLDEPTIGLHQRDNLKLITTLKHLRDLGNSVIIVEHDRATIESADHVLDFGPRAGQEGGQIVAQGTPTQIKTNPKSLTGKYLSGKKKISVPSDNFSALSDQFPVLTITNCHQHNLKHIDVDFPLGKLICVTGVSGSGKSTLVHTTLYYALLQRFGRMTHETPGQFSQLKGTEHVTRVSLIDQSPIGRTPRSNPVTYTKAFDYIRHLLAQTKTARIQGFGPGRFSFNVKGGRCEACQGEGQVKITMQFLPDVYVACDVCHGQRYNQATLEIAYKGKSVADILDLTVAQAVDFFSSHPTLHHKLITLKIVGLDYIKLGQPAPTLSGGEAQRIKLAKELGIKSAGHTLYLLDEPTTGLHFEDLNQLLDVLKALVSQGNTIILIEHNLDIIKSADWIIDLGPEGGDGGGDIVATGTPRQVAKNRHSYTGQFLQKLLH
jgi:excinuclease ABC subunit A